MIRKRLNNNNGTFRIIAVRVFSGCDKAIRRALWPDTTYFLCNDYEDNYDEKGLWLGIRKVHSHYLENFFALPKEESKTSRINRKPTVNVTAIVGKNGDGKSSLIELLLRIINNFGVRAGFTEDQESLSYIQGVEATLFYEVDGRLYSITCIQQDLKASFIDVARGKEEIRNHQRLLFYTVVANYSIYAYNARHLQGEVEEGNDCWINGVFHKNDSYQTPLVLNPMRTDGNFDVNREENLCRQRLMSIYADLGDDEEARRINGNKIATGFAFNLEERSKLETITLKLYFRDTWKSTSLNGAAGDLERQLRSMKSNNPPIKVLVGAEYQDQMWFWKKYAAMWKKYQPLFKLAETKAEEVYQENGAIDDESETDLKRYLRAAYNIFDYSLTDKKERHLVLESIKYVDKNCKKLTGLQFQRLVLVMDVCELWAKHPWFTDNTFSNAIKHYVNGKGEKSIERCHALLYVIYKTINIFTQYKRFRKHLSIDPFFYLFEPRYEDGSGYYTGLPECFEMLFADGNKDRIVKKYDTLKLRQTINYLIRGSFKVNRTDGYKTEEQFGYRQFVTFDRLQHFINEAKKKCDEETIALLPPPIFVGDILVREKEDRTGSPRFKMSSLSSGELQMLNSISTYIYHLRNLNYHTGVGDAIEYSNVNLILEEVELYFHPEYQRQYVYRMLKQIEQARLHNIRAINIILVTHSPFVLSDIPKNNVLFLRDGRPERVMQEDTFGANIHALLQNGFFLEGAPIGEFAKVKINRMFERLHKGDYGEDLFEEICLVSEPLLKTQLYQLYSLNKLPHQHPQLSKLEARIKELEERLNDRY